MENKKNESKEVKIKYHEYKLAKAKADINFHKKRIEELQNEK